MPVSKIRSIVRAALKEDLAFDDITTKALIPAPHKSEARIIVKEDCVVCGIEILQTAFRTMDSKIAFRSLYKDGQPARKNACIAVIRGRTRGLLAAERVALNFLGHLSGIATKTNHFVRKVRPLKTKILDTRKTLPGLRRLEKYAVTCGGGMSHRANLKQAMLIKDNHLSVSGGRNDLGELIRKVRKATRKPIEIEVDSLSQFRAAIAGGPDIILLDNMSAAQIKTAVTLRNKKKGNKKPLLEASGGVNLKTVRAIARSGVDRISIGALTHSAKSIDVSMEIIPQ